MAEKYAIGVDYGTESGRVLLVRVRDGKETAAHVTAYPHGVMTERLPGPEGVRLGPDWALQHPDDYLEVLRVSVPAVLKGAGVSPGQVIGIGLDFTSCTILPVDGSGVPLCFQDSLKEEPHAYVKLWKHHAAQEEADRINETAARRGEKFLSSYGGKVSSEWMIPKVWQVLNEAPHVYEQAELFLEAADWVVWQMTGRLVRSSCCAGYKAFWHKADGYPSAAFFRELDPRLERVTETKLAGEVRPIGSKAGALTEEAADMMGLRPGIAVAVGVIDAHAGVPGTGAVRAGQMVMAMGTSLCHILLSDREVAVEGVSGVVGDGVVPGLYAYEAGQPAVGDLFGWYVAQGVPAYVQQAAEAEGVSVHAWLESRAAALKPGQHGLLALDWWNGNRSVLVDAELSGLIVGLTLQTRPEDIYRSLLEATAFGTRKIIETFEAAGVEVRELYACGGLPERNRLLMQIYADVTGREIRIAESSQTTALGAAIFAAVAAGSSGGGYDSLEQAAERMTRLRERVYRPAAEHRAVYDELYREYNRLYDEFGRGGLAAMKALRRIRRTYAE